MREKFMAVPTFTRTSSAEPLFYLSLAVPPPGLTDYAVAFLPDPSFEVLPDSLPLSETWTTSRGIYLFLGSNVDSEEELVSAVRSYVGTKKTRFLWITNPAAPPNEWAASQIEVQQPTGSNQGQLSQLAQILFRNYLLAIIGGSTISLTASADGFTFASGDGQESPVYFETGSDRIDGSGALQLPFSGNSVGCLQFSLPLREEGPVSDLDKLDACCRYFVDDTEWPGYMQSLRYPIIDLSNGPITLYGNLDPVNPLTPARSLLSFLETSASPGTPLNSAFRTVYGELVQLTPCTSTTYPTGPSLVFSVRPTTTAPNDSAPFYMTFEGSFSLSFPTSSVSSDPIAERMMCGFSGVEYAGFVSAAGNLIYFFSGRPAYAPVLKQPGDTRPRAEDATPLASLATTSWAYIAPATDSGVEYFAQPQESVIYQATMDFNKAVGDDEDFLYYLEVFAGTFPALSAPPAMNGELSAFPMVPYGMVDPEILEDFRQFELQILSPYRRNLLVNILDPTETGPKSGQRLGATPQGLLLQFDQQLKYWEMLTLARNQDGAQLLQLADITGPFKAALQSNQLFAVISNRDEFIRYCSVVGSFNLTIDDWTFELSPDSWLQNRTLMIIKYAAKSIEEMAGDTGTWSWVAAANGYTDHDGDLATTQAELLVIIDDAKSRAETEPEYRSFYMNVISNPSWTGVLFLRTTLSTSSFPPELQGLSAGIEGEFFAHHIGINLTPIHNVDQVLTQQDSSLFGLIAYEDEEDLFFDGVDYAYKVLSLKVVFKNSAVSTFSSQIELMINKLFSSFASLENSERSNNILLNGYYQRQEGEATYVFVEEGSDIFRIKNSALDVVEITRAQFITLATQSNLPGQVQTQFVLAGNLQFHELSEFDLYSFGASYEIDGTTIVVPGRLQFSNLIIAMNFPAAAPAAKSFAFEAGSMAFDLSHSLARTDSLFNHFPLKMAGLIQAPPDNAPGDLGYMSVRSPLQQGAMDYPWYALSFDLDLGTLGALAGDIGLTVTLLAAWAPSTAQKRVYLGIKIPGLSSVLPQIPIEGVLRLSFGGIEFTVSRENGVEYILRFKNIALMLLSLSFPPGQVDIYMFGDPSGGRSGSLGWYMAYAKDEESKSESGAELAARNLYRLALKSRASK